MKALLRLALASLLLEEEGLCEVPRSLLPSFRPIQGPGPSTSLWVAVQGWVGGFISESAASLAMPPAPFRPGFSLGPIRFAQVADEKPGPGAGAS